MKLHYTVPVKDTLWRIFYLNLQYYNYQMNIDLLLQGRKYPILKLVQPLFHNAFNEEEILAT